MTKPRYAWESSVFIAWLKADETAPLFDIDAVINEIDAKEANLIVSVTAYMEVLEAKHPADQMNLFRKFLKRSNVTVADNNVNIAEKTGSIRSKAVNAGRKIDTADATFVATAVLYQADMLHTLDEGLLKFDGSPIVDGLRICMPQTMSGQRSLFGQRP